MSIKLKVSLNLNNLEKINHQDRLEVSPILTEFLILTFTVYFLSTKRFGDFKSR